MEHRSPHFKDPIAYPDEQGNTVMMFCTHPFNWASSNTALAVRPAASLEFGPVDHTFFPRGFTWDVAVSRISGVLRVPRSGIFAAAPSTCLYFYSFLKTKRLEPFEFERSIYGGSTAAQNGRLDFFAPHQPFAIPHGMEQRERELRQQMKLPDSYAALAAEGFRPPEGEPRVYRLYRKNWGLSDERVLADYRVANQSAASKRRSDWTASACWKRPPARNGLMPHH